MHAHCIMRRRLVLAALTASGLLSVASPPDRAAAQTAWPQRTVKLVVPLGPGSGADIGARLVADRLSKTWGQPVVVENRPGGDAITAITSFLAANDDHTMLYAPSGTFVGHPYLHAKMPYDPKAFVPIARVSNTIVSYVVPTDLKPKSLAELAALAKAEPGKLNWAAITGLNDFLFRSYLKDSNLEMTRVPYRDPVQALNDVAEGRVQVYGAAYAITRPQVEAGKVKVLAIANTARASILPDVPTAREAGYPALEFDGLIGLFGLASMPQDLRERIAAAVIAAVPDKEVASRLTLTGQVVNPGTPAEFADSIQRQSLVAARAAQILGLKHAE